MTTFAIVGAAGQVGRRLMTTLGGIDGARVLGITRNSMSAAPLLADGMDIRVGSVTDDRSLLDGADVVVNTALEIDRPKRARGRNEALMAALLAGSRDAVLIHFSSVAVYGSCVDGTFSTFERPRPDSTYGKEKLRLERFALAEAGRSGQRLVILRVGHVYGPGQGISREIFDVSVARTWRLPFGGTLPSNGVHVDRLARALPVLASAASGQAVLNGIDAPQRTWGDLYAMHARAAGVDGMESMDDADAEARRDEYRRLAGLSLPPLVAQQVWRWARGLPLKSLVNVTAVRQATEAALLALPESVERAVDRRYTVFSAGQHLDAGGPPPPGPPPWYYSDAVAGPSLPPRTEYAATLDKEIQELAAWYAEWARPRWRAAGGTRA